MKANRKWLSLLVIASMMTSTVTCFAEATLPIASTVNVADVNHMAIGDTYEGFKLVSKQWSDDADSNILQFEHVKSGGKVIYFENNDRHKSFDVFFRTPVHDNTGVNHILEHSVLSGSAKYPSKSPFMTMAQTSVNTFANALTYGDHTAYPFSSQNDKDFSNLMNVYLDAVFAPKIVTDERIFQREGWGYEIDPKSGKLGYKGVVFSEMKGSMSDPSNILYDDYFKNLFPNTIFAYNSGGNPEEIVNLTHAQLVNTYKKYYHPSNATIYLYGKMDIENKLKLINQEYFSKYDKKVIDTDFGTQKPFTKTKYATSYYHVDPGTNMSNRSMISVGYGMPTMSKKDMFAMEMLVNLMTNLEISPMNVDFKKSNIGQNFSGTMHLENEAISVEFSTSDTDRDQKTVLERFIKNELTKISKNGIDKDLINASLNSQELTKRLTKLSAEKGNDMRYLVELGVINYNDPMYFFDLDPLVDEIKRDALNQGYFEKLIDKYLLNNTHKLVIVLEPKTDLNKDTDQRLNAKLAKFKKSLTTKEFNALKAKLAAFEKWKNDPDTDADLGKLPSLSLKDIDYSVQTGDYTTKTISNVPVIEHSAATNKTVSLTYYFDLNTLTQEEIRDLAIYTGTFDIMGTKKQNLDAVTKNKMKYTNGISVDTQLITGGDSFTIKGNKLVFDTTFLASETNNAMNLLNDIATNHIYDDEKMLKYYVDQLTSGYTYYYMNEGDDLAWETLSKNLTPVGQYGYENSKETMDYYYKLKYSWATEYPKLVKRLESIQKKALNANGLHVSIIAEPSSISKVEENLSGLVQGLNQEKFPEVKLEFKPMISKIGLVMPSQVQYVYKGFNVHQTGGKIDGSTFVFAQFMNNEYLYPNIRVKGGAYGGSMFVTLSGNVVFYSYRDPGMANTLATIDNSIAYLKKLKLTQKDIEPYIISALGSFDSPTSVFDQGFLDDRRVFGGRTAAQDEALMKSIAETTPEDLKAFIKLLEDGLKNASVVVTGSESELNKNKKLLNEIKDSLE